MIAAVLASAALHATWNFLLRRAGGGTLIVALSKVAEAVLLLPFALYALRGADPPPGQYLIVVLVGATLVLGNYAALSAAYRIGDLSLVYPIARGSTFLFLPVLGLLVFAEQLGTTGWLALVAIMVGIALLPLPAFDSASVRAVGRHLRSRAMLFALAAGLATACYTVWDKYAVGFIDPFLYFYGYTVVLALAFGVTIARSGRAEVRAAWRAHPGSIVLIGLLNAAAYLLILYALQDGMATQVLAVRQVSIAIGVVLGWQFLAERLTMPRAMGALFVTLGCVLAAAI